MKQHSCGLVEVWFISRDARKDMKEWMCKTSGVSRNAVAKADIAGYLPNIRMDKSGKDEIELSSHLLGIGDTEFSIIGKSIIIHAEKDDFQSQPDGGEGEKIACGVIRATGG